MWRQMAKQLPRPELMPTTLPWTPRGASLSISLSLLSAGREGNGNPLQYSCLENPMDGGVWKAAVHGVEKSQTPLKRLSSGSSS